LRGELRGDFVEEGEGVVVVVVVGVGIVVVVGEGRVVRFEVMGESDWTERGVRRDSLNNERRFKQRKGIK
jgi:hypothetical protein